MRVSADVRRSSIREMRWSPQLGVRALTSCLDGNLVLEIKSALEDELRHELAGLKSEEAAVFAD